MPAARHTDPATSHEAAQSVRYLTDTQIAIMRLFLSSDGLHDEELVRLYTIGASIGRYPQASASGIRSRRAELVNAGQLGDSGRRHKTASGRKAIVWERVYPAAI